MMPAKQIRLTCSHVFALIAVLCVFAIGVKAQTGGVTLNGTISKTVALSVLPNSTNGNVKTDVTSSGNTVRIMLSGDTAEAPVIRVPLLVRSNSNFKIAAVVESNTAAVAQLSVTDVRATGMWVSPQAIAGVIVPRQFDLRGINESASSAPNLLDNGSPLLVVSGPCVSAGGTLASPNNALQITLVIGLKPQPAHVWPIHLTLVGSPE